MSNLMPSPDALECRSDAAPEPSLEAYPARSADLGGGLIVRRALPHRERRLVGPLAFDAGKPIRPGQVNLMTAGRAMVVIGDFAGVRSPAQTCSRMVGVELAADRDGRTDVPLAPSFEHAIMLIDGHVGLDDRVWAPDTLYYLGTGREQLSLELRAGARLMLLGGEPFSERVLMWWTGERPRLVTAYYVERPDADNPEHRVRFGTSGHRGSSLALGFNEEALRGRA